MCVVPSTIIVSFSFISAQVLGLALSPAELVPAEPLDLKELATQYISELATQNLAIDGLEEQLSLDGDRPKETISELCSLLIESYYRQMEPRNRMIEITPADSVLATDSIEYLVAVASRYATNAMHIARAIKKDSFEQDEALTALAELRKEQAKTIIFDQVLFKLANVSVCEERRDQALVGGESVSDREQSASEKEYVPSKVEETEVELVAVMVEETYTTTTETIVTSYMEASVIGE